MRYQKLAFVLMLIAGLLIVSEWGISQVDAGHPVAKGGGMRGGGMRGGGMHMAGKPGGIHGVGKHGPGPVVPFAGGFGRAAFPGFIGGGNFWGPGFGLDGLTGFGFGFAAASPYSLGQIPIPPYHSLHPPVYYSYPVPRTYGHSPFPYPGWMRTPDVAVVQACPQDIENPFVVPELELNESKTAQPSADEFANRDPEPQWIINPFVQQVARDDRELPDVQVAVVPSP